MKGDKPSTVSGTTIMARSLDEQREMTDYCLVQACLKGDGDCFAELVARYKNLVYSIILKNINDREEADDLAQDVFLKIYKNLAAYSTEFKFSTWVMRITTNHIIDRHRKKKMDTVPLEDYAHEPALNKESSPEDIVIKREEARRINKIVEGLPDIYKVPIVLYHKQGLSYQEISDIIGEPLSKIKNRIFRGRKLLKDTISQSGYDLVV